ncbi:MAG: hypothetical protein RBT38_00825 [Bacteroidales bacterium]|nr:hypothetical protein [Bacteroidales bacterium]
MTRIFYTLILLCLPLFVMTGQNQERERFFQVSGLITDEEDRAVPNAGIISIKLKRGSVSERTGIYTITSTPGDTIFFRALGFKRKLIVLPVDFEGRHFTLDVSLSTDTIPIENVVVMPWRSYSDFIKDMTEISPLDPEIENMNKNIESVAEAVSNTRDVRITPEAGYRYAMQQNFNMTATRSQYPINNLLNPLAWAKFVNSLKNGLFRNDDSEKPSRPAKTRNKKKKKQ